jgi:hypothetical protein
VAYLHHQIRAARLILLAEAAPRYLGGSSRRTFNRAINADIAVTRHDVAWLPPLAAMAVPSFGLGPDFGDEETDRPGIGKILHISGDGLPFGRSEGFLHRLGAVPVNFCDAPEGHFGLIRRLG